MAASGIAEHNEARRKEMWCQRRAFKQRALAQNLCDQLGDNPDFAAPPPTNQQPTNQDTYEAEVNQIRKVGSPPGLAGNDKHDAASVDQLRRDCLRQQQLCEYSAKIPNRYTSKDYISQW